MACTVLCNHNPHLVLEHLPDRVGKEPPPTSSHPTPAVPPAPLQQPLPPLQVCLFGTFLINRVRPHTAFRLASLIPHRVRKVRLHHERTSTSFLFLTE